MDRRLFIVSAGATVSTILPGCSGGTDGADGGSEATTTSTPTATPDSTDATTTDNSAISQGPVSWKELSDADYRFSIDYPEAGTAKVTKDETEVFLCRISIPKQLFAVLSAQKTGSSIEEWVDTNQKLMKESEQYREADVVQADWKPIDGAKKITVENYVSGSHELKQVILLASGPGDNPYSYKAMFASAQSDFDQAWETYFEHMARSFSVTE